MLEPLLQGFNEPAGKSPSSPVKCGGDDASDDSSFGDACEEPSPEKPTDSRVADGAVERNEASPDSGAIEDDIAALEAELEADGGLRGDDDDDEGGTRLMHQLRGEEAVRRAAWSLFEVLLPRCVGLEGQGSETRLEEPTSFSNRYVHPGFHFVSTTSIFSGVWTCRGTTGRIENYGLVPLYDKRYKAR